LLLPEREDLVAFGLARQDSHRRNDFVQHLVEMQCKQLGGAGVEALAALDVETGDRFVDHGRHALIGIHGKAEGFERPPRTGEFLSQWPFEVGFHPRIDFRVGGTGCR
jgi:hypothetical protein